MEDGVIYLSGHANANLALVAEEYEIGLMAQPECRHTKQISQYPYWAADNGCFNKGDMFDLDAYLGWLGGTNPERCLFATAPDVMGDAELTLNRSMPVLSKLRSMGYRAAFVLQDGCEPELVPMQEADCLFIGGTDTFKESRQVEALARYGKEHGKWVHMGRVNSYRRYRYAEDIGCDSVDGTFLAFGPDKNLPRLLKWIDRSRNQTLLL